MLGNQYNTLEGVAGAAGLLLIVAFGAVCARSRGRIALLPWAATFFPLGLILVILGAVMSTTWPLGSVPQHVSPHCCTGDNIIFGEPSFFFGAILLALALLLVWLEHRPSSWDDEAGRGPEGWDRFARPLGSPASNSGRLDVDNDGALRRLAPHLLPLAIVGAIAGLILLSISAVGAYYRMFLAPPTEPFSRIFRFGDIETIYIAGTYALTGIGAVLVPFALYRFRYLKLTGAVLALSGLSWLFVSLVSYFGHVALS
jgi:uncharacterized membrane protein